MVHKAIHQDGTLKCRKKQCELVHAWRHKLSLYFKMVLFELEVYGGHILELLCI